MYNHPQIKQMTFKSKIISDLFELLHLNQSCYQKPGMKIPIKNLNIFRMYYISGMTDKFAINTHSKFFNLNNF